MNRSIITLIFLSCMTSSMAAYKGSISFTQNEMKYHQKMVNTMVKASESCLLRHKKEHQTFYRSNCFNRKINGTYKKVCLSKFYGDRRYSMSRNQRRADGKKLEYIPDVLKRLGIPSSYAKKMKRISCVGLALQCLKEGLLKTNQKKQWDKILTFTKKNGVGGTALQYALGKLGWRTFYWNPSPYWSIEDDMKRWDKEEKDWLSKGYHAYRYNSVLNRGKYWFNNVNDHDGLVGFKKTSPKLLKNKPFWIGTAHTGYHVFPGTGSNVVEAHSTRHITDLSNFEFSVFNPLAKGGGPKWSNTEKYRSGLIVIPPVK